MTEKIKNIRAIFVIVALFSFSFIVNVKTIEGIPLCFFKALGGFDCPGCGLLRSFISISHGDFSKSVQYHLLGPIVYVFFFLYLIKNILELLQKEILLPFFLGKDKVATKLMILLFMSQWSVKVFRQICIRWF